MKSGKRHSFEISTPELTYLLYADTEQEKDDWIGRVGKAIVRCSSTYYSQNGGQKQQRGPTLVRSPYAAQRPSVDDESDDDDVLYEDPNNPNPYFND